MTVAKKVYPPLFTEWEMMACIWHERHWYLFAQASGPALIKRYRVAWGKHEGKLHNEVYHIDSVLLPEDVRNNAQQAWKEHTWQ